MMFKQNFFDQANDMLLQDEDSFDDFDKENSA